MTEKRFTKCEYYRENDDISMMGYCVNPIRHKKTNGICLLYCQGSICELDTKEICSDKLCEKYREYLCNYCCYRQPLGHCQYYRGSYTLKGGKGDVE